MKDKSIKSALSPIIGVIKTSPAQNMQIRKMFTVCRLLTVMDYGERIVEFDAFLNKVKNITGKITHFQSTKMLMSVPMILTESRQYKDSV